MLKRFAVGETQAPLRNIPLGCRGVSTAHSRSLERPRRDDHSPTARVRARAILLGPTRCKNLRDSQESHEASDESAEDRNVPVTARGKATVGDLVLSM